MASRDVQGQRLHVALAAHSPRVEPALQGLEAAAARVAMKAPRIPVAWNVTGAALPERRARCGVLAAPSARTGALCRRPGVAARTRVSTFPRSRSAPHAGARWPSARCPNATFIASMRRGKDDWDVLMHALAAAYVQGAAIDWAEVQRPHAARRVALPTYPFERQSYWVPAAAAAKAATGRRVPSTSAGHVVAWPTPGTPGAHVRAVAAPRRAVVSRPAPPSRCGLGGRPGVSRDRGRGRLGAVEPRRDGDRLRGACTAGAARCGRASAVALPAGRRGRRRAPFRDSRPRRPR